jgi:hypothetical protein
MLHALFYFGFGLVYSLYITKGDFKPHEDIITRFFVVFVIAITWPIVMISRFLSTW